MSNSVNMKTLLFRTDFLFPISSFTLFYHCLCGSQNLSAKEVPSFVCQSLTYFRTETYMIVRCRNADSTKVLSLYIEG